MRISLLTRPFAVLIPLPHWGEGRVKEPVLDPSHSDPSPPVGERAAVRAETLAPSDEARAE
jgi:hypothetical protein